MKNKTLKVSLASLVAVAAVAGCGGGTQESSKGGNAPKMLAQTETVPASARDGVSDSAAGVAEGTQAGLAALNAPVCTLQAESYSDAYDITAGNTGGQFRGDNVDIEATADAGGGFDVGWIASGEWLAHNNVTFPKTGAYTLAYRVAAPSAGGVISADLNGGTIHLGNTTVPATGGWQSWATVQRTINVNAGTYKLGTFIRSGGFNLNWIRIAGASCGATTPTPPSGGWKLAWADEFNGNSLDMSKWNIEVNGNGGGNNELQYYTARPENIRVGGGQLVIEARREGYQGKQYTSGRITTQNKASWQ